MEKHRCFGCMSIITEEVCPHCGYSAFQNNDYRQLPVGTILRGQYLVGRVLGQGGFGITYIGLDTYLDMVVAIKEFYPANAVNRNISQSYNVLLNTGSLEQYYANGRKKFLMEGRTLAKLSHIPEIVTVHSLFAENNTAYIVMEYIQGTDLRHYVRKKGGKLKPSELFPILEPVFLALHAVHKAGLVHRDISPDNIMLKTDGSIKLLDFGAARDSGNPDADVDMNRSTEAIVKHGFAPAEQYRNRGNLGPWTDEYALCATVYYCLTGTVPPDALVRLTENTHPNWDISGLTPQQRSALERGMSTRAKERSGSLKMLHDNLYGAAPPNSIPSADPYPTRPEEAVSSPAESDYKPTTKKRVPIALIAGLVAALVLSIGVLRVAGNANRNRMDAPQTETPSAIIATETDPHTRAESSISTEGIPQHINPYANSVLRISKNSPLHTSLLIADELKTARNVSKFNVIVITGGTNNANISENPFLATALSSAYLANVNHAPLLLSCVESYNSHFAQQHNALIVEYIRTNLTSGGKVYIVGTSEIVPLSIDNALAGYNVVRIAGSTYYDTNLAVLRESGISANQTVLVCNGEGSAGITLCSAIGLPILLIDGNSDRLTRNQDQFLQSLSGNYCIVGGTSSISSILENEISRYGDTTRLTGGDRFEVSAQVAEQFFTAPDSVMLVHPENKMDALCAGTLAYARGVPILFADASNFDLAAKYIHQKTLRSGFVLGTQEQIPDVVIREIFNAGGSHSIEITPLSNDHEPETDTHIAIPEVSIPKDAFIYNDHSYYVFNDNSIATFDEAKAYCESLGGYLAVISSADENDALFKYGMSLGHNLIYFGYSDEHTEGQWLWMEQEYSGYTNWHPGQPNDGENGNYGQFVRQFSDGPGNGEWSDAYWGGYLGRAFICEWPVTTEESN